jgi:hypothetical protein
MQVYIQACWMLGLSAYVSGVVGSTCLGMLVIVYIACIVYAVQQWHTSVHADHHLMLPWILVAAMVAGL